MGLRGGYDLWHCGHAMVFEPSYVIIPLVVRVVSRWLAPYGGIGGPIIRGPAPAPAPIIRVDFICGTGGGDFYRCRSITTVFCKVVRGFGSYLQGTVDMWAVLEKDLFQRSFGVFLRHRSCESFDYIFAQLLVCTGFSYDAQIFRTTQSQQRPTKNNISDHRFIKYEMQGPRVKGQYAVFACSS